MRSAFDANWIQNAPHQNPFYVALPYNDVDNHHTKPEVVSIIPWFKQAFVRDGQSVCKDRWVAIRKGNRVAFAQWEDVGPFQTDHWQYVFGSERPRPNRNRDAGLGVSPAVQQFLGLNGIVAADVRRRIICELFSAIYEWWRISLCSTIVCCRGLRPKTTVC
jgi:hypothetical protein